MIFVDMDGVLCDFVGEAMRLHGATYDEATWPRLEWAVEKVLDVTADQLWARIEREEVLGGFWCQLQPYPWLVSLLDLVGAFDFQFRIATSPSRSSRCPGQKAAWLYEHLGIGPDRYHMGSAKHFLAGPGRILIDDNDTNCAKWREHGGTAFLFPQPWNSAHDQMGDRLSIVRDGLEAMR